MAAPDPVEPGLVLAVAALNPAAILVSLWMGSKADQPQKLLVAAFAGAAAGFALIWLAAELRIEFIARPARASAGIFVLELLTGLAWAWIGYRFLRKR